MPDFNRIAAMPGFGNGYASRLRADPSSWTMPEAAGAPQGPGPSAITGILRTQALEAHAGLVQARAAALAALDRAECLLPAVPTLVVKLQPLRIRETAPPCVVSFPCCHG